MTQIIIYVCPNDCGNYYAAPDFRADVSPQIVRTQHRRSEEGEQVPSFARVECPDCRARGVHVARVPMLVTAMERTASIDGPLAA